MAASSSSNAKKTTATPVKGKPKRGTSPAVVHEEETSTNQSAAGPSSSTTRPAPSASATAASRQEQPRRKKKKSKLSRDGTDGVDAPSPSVQLFMKALDCALISSEMLSSQELFELSQACRGAAVIVRERVKAIGGRPWILTKLDKNSFPGARNLSLRFDQVIQTKDSGPAAGPCASSTSLPPSSSSTSFMWTVPCKNTNKLQAAFKAFAASRLQSLKVQVFCSSRKKKLTKRESGLKDPFLFLLPGLESASHRLTSMSIKTEPLLRSWGYSAPMLPGVVRIFSEVTFHQLLHLTLAHYRMDLITEALSPALQRDAFPRMQSIELMLKEDPPLTSVPSVATFLRHLFSGACLTALREAKLHGRLGTLPDGSSVLGCLLEENEANVSLAPEKLKFVVIEDKAALRCVCASRPSVESLII